MTRIVRTVRAGSRYAEGGVAACTQRIQGVVAVARWTFYEEDDRIATPPTSTADASRHLVVPDGTVPTDRPLLVRVRPNVR
jgi:hypothetical protein